MTFLACLSSYLGMAQSSYWGSDNKDGTYTNPIILGDYPDPDIIRVGNEEVKESIDIPTAELYLRVNITKRGTAPYSYSFDNETYTSIGVEASVKSFL